jgi:hypothetical protein
MGQHHALHGTGGNPPRLGSWPSSLQVNNTSVITPRCGSDSGQQATCFIGANNIRIVVNCN